MPQNNVLPDWRATYPNDAPAQKPGGVTVATTATAPRVPNKPTYSAGTIQSYDPDLGQMVFDKIVDAIQDRVEEAQEATQEEVEEENTEEEGGEPTPPTRRTRRR